MHAAQVEVLRVFVDPQAASLTVATLGTFLLAGWLLWLDPRGPSNRAFAAFLALRAMNLAASTVSAVGTDPDLVAAAVAWGRPAYVATLAALAYFVVTYPTRLGWLGSHPRGAWIAASVGGAMVIAAVLQPCIVFCRAASGATVWGPWSAIPVSLAFALAGWGSLSAQARASDGPRREAAMLVGGIFLLNAIFDGARAAGLYAVVASESAPGADLVSTIAPATVVNPWLYGFLLAPLAGLGLSATVLGLALRRWAKEGRAHALLAWGIGAGVALLTGLFVGVFGANTLVGLSLFILGLWRMAVPAIVTYAVLRHRLFGLDERVRRGISRGSVVAIFAVVFVVGTQVASEYLNDAYGYLVGGIGAGLLFFAIRPIEKIATRAVDAALPSARRADRASLYGAAVELALADGRLTRAEERALAKLATQLGLDPERAHRLLEEVEARMARLDPTRPDLDLSR